ncbi:MAG: phage portal protein [Faecalispora sporosphaeroides]|uniref:phage portal protein n=1 Tax=Faecalispora sporosphaeroides TaxID=1549 RepID=UPI0020461571|nr:MAG TPA: PORTAL PROTEIN [Caudoviricetes sp.]
MQDLKAIRKLIENTESQYKAFAVSAQQGFDYYGNKDDIKRTGAAAIDEINGYLKKKGANPLRSADNRVSFNKHKIVVDQKTGYLFSVPPSFDLPGGADEGNALLKQVKDTIGTQWPKVIKQLGIDASNTGKAWLAYWINEAGEFDYWYINPLTVRPIYDRSTVKKRLKYLVRVYDYLTDTGDAVTRYEVWDDKEVAYLIRPAVTAQRPKPQIEFEELPNGDYNVQPHTYGRIPFIEFQNNAHAVGDLPMYKDIIDALDKLVSGFCNDVDDLQEIIWVIKNYDGERSETSTDADGEDIQKPVDLLQMLKAKKWVSVDENGGLETVRGDIPYEARSALRDILNEEFWPAAMSVNPNPEKIGNQSGDYMEHLFNLLELKAGLMETEFRNSIDEFLRAILRYLGADEQKQFTQTWKRTKPQNAESIAGIITSTPDTVMSDETKTKLHPLIDDWQGERKKVEAEQKKKEQNTLDLLAQQEKRQAMEQQPNANDGGGNDE